jgi:hypothetical protein
MKKSPLFWCGDLSLLLTLLIHEPTLEREEKAMNLISSLRKGKRDGEKAWEYHITKVRY